MPVSKPLHSCRLCALILLSWLGLACGTAPPPPPAAPHAIPSGTETEAPPLMPFGVPECDSFITRYVACVEQRVPADQQARLMDDLHEHRAKWRELARMEQGELAVGLSCRGVAQRLKGGLIVDYGCEF